MRPRIFIPAAAVLLAAAAAFLILSAPDDEFDVSCSRAPDAYVLEAGLMTGSDTHSLELSGGERLKVTFKTESGSMSLNISAPDGTALYSGNGTAASDFILSIRESGSYTVTVSARHARGRISIMPAEGYDDSYQGGIS